MTAPQPDPFAVLGLPSDPDITDDDVHRAYRRQLRATHPDQGGTAAHAAQVTAAYNTLRSAVRRADALQNLTTPEPPPERPLRPGGPPPSPKRREQLRRKVAEERRRQGLPTHITDHVTLTKIADLMHLTRQPDRRRTQRRPPADLEIQAAPPPPAGAPPLRRAPPPPRPLSRLRALPARIRHGRPHYLTGRILAAAAVPALAYLAAPTQPSWLALATGALTWLGLTARHDLAPHPANGR